MRLLPYLNALYHRRLLQTEVMRPLQPCYRAAAAGLERLIGRRTRTQPALFRPGVQRGRHV
jgi:hypothetical protein